MYIAGKLRDDRRGEPTKLGKALYFADFAHVRRHGRAITGAEYYRTPRVIAPRPLIAVRDRLIDGGEAEIRSEDYLGHPTRRFVPLRDADTSVFSADELATIDDVLADLDGLTAAQVSDLIREEPAWKLRNEDETIPYESAFLAKRQIVTPTARRLAEQAMGRYGLTAQA